MKSITVRTLNQLARNLLIVFALGILPIPMLIWFKYDILTACLFSLSLVLIWTDGFLTYYAFNENAKELNPMMDKLNQRIGKKGGLFLSRFIGSSLALIALLMGNLYLLLLIAWLFSIVICLGAIALAFSFDKNKHIEDTQDS